MYWTEVYFNFLTNKIKITVNKEKRDKELKKDKVIKKKMITWCFSECNFKRAKHLIQVQYLLAETKAENTCKGNMCLVKEER